MFREPVLPIVVRDGGNHAARGLRIARPAGPEAHPALPYLILDPSPSALGDTILHDTGHLLQSLAPTPTDTRQTPPLDPSVDTSDPSV